MLADEARTFGRYVLGQSPCERAVALYARFGGDVGGERGERDAAIVRFAAHNAWSIAPLDAALAFFHPDALLRRKLLFLGAILEAQPEHCDAFLPRDRSPWYALAVGASLVRGAFNLAAGALLLPLLR